MFGLEVPRRESRSEINLLRLQLHDYTCLICESRCADRREIAQRFFFGPFRGKSDAASSFLMVPRPTFDIPWPPSVGFCSHFDSVPRIKKCELSTDFGRFGGLLGGCLYTVGDQQFGGWQRRVRGRGGPAECGMQHTKQFHAPSRFAAR